MKRISPDPLHKKNGTIQLEYRVITENGLKIECTTRTFRCSEEQRNRLEAFVKELCDGTPEIAAAFANKPETRRS